MRAWQTAQIGLARCCSICFAHASAVRRPCRALQAPAHPAAAAAAAYPAGSPESTCRAAPPKSGSGYEVTVRMLPCPSSPPRLGSVERHPAELRAVNVRDAVVLRQALDSGRCSSHSADRARCGFRAECSRRTVPSPARKTGRRLSSNSGKRPGRASDRRQIPQIQPLPGEIVDQRIAIAGRPACGAPAASAPRRRSACPPRPDPSSSSSGTLLHRKNESREASSRSLMRYAVAARCAFAGRARRGT